MHHRNSRNALALALLLVGVGACTDVPIAPATPFASQVTGDGQTGVPGYRLPNSIVVHVADADGRPIAGDTIDFSAADEFAAVEPGSVVVTDNAGNATVFWRLGATLGTQTLSARSRLPGLSTQLITATAHSNLMPSIDGGDASLCGVDVSGTLGCWLPPRLGVPDLLPHIKTVTSSLHFKQVAMLGTALQPSGTFDHASACALTDAGRVWCFTVDSMANVAGLSELPGTYPALTQLVSSGFSGTTYCALTAVGEAWCWGADNSSGQLGDGTTTGHTSPAAVATAARFVQLDLAYETVCGLSTAGEAWCWGGNVTMKAGAAIGARVLAPILVNASAGFTRVRVLSALDTGCGFLASGGVMCWGYLGAFGGPFSTATPTLIPSLSATIDIVDNLNFNDFQLAILFLLDRGPALSPFPADVGLQPPIGLIKDVTLRHGAGLICGTATAAIATLCWPNDSHPGVDRTPPGGFIERPPVIGVPFP